MNIDISKLQKVVKKSDGSIKAQCPACAAVGRDTTGNHLRVYAGGKFNCVVQPKDKSHNKEILQLVGSNDGKQPERAKVKIRPYKMHCMKVIGVVPRTTWEELGFVRDPNRPLRMQR